MRVADRKPIPAFSNAVTLIVVLPVMPVIWLICNQSGSESLKFHDPALVWMIMLVLPPSFGNSRFLRLTVKVFCLFFSQPEQTRLEARKTNKMYFIINCIIAN